MATLVFEENGGLARESVCEVGRQMSSSSNKIKLSTYIEFLWAATVSHRVESKFSDRGGIMIVAPPASLKTAILGAIEENGLGIMGCSDITTKTLVEARDLIAAKKIHTLMFYDFQKVYERKQDTAQNIIGNLRALMCEGFTSAAFEQQNLVQTKARALVIAATTPAMYRARMGEWDESGFSRRMIFSVYSLENPEILVKAIMENEPVALGTISNINIPFNLTIPMEKKEGDEDVLRRMLQKGQRGEEVPLVMLRKILAVLRWKARTQKKKDYSLDVMREFGKSMRDSGAEIVL